MVCVFHIECVAYVRMAGLRCNSFHMISVRLESSLCSTLLSAPDALQKTEYRLRLYIQMRCC